MGAVWSMESRQPRKFLAANRSFITCAKCCAVISSEENRCITKRKLSNPTIIDDCARLHIPYRHYNVKPALEPSIPPAGYDIRVECGRNLVELEKVNYQPASEILDVFLLRIVLFEDVVLNRAGNFSIRTLHFPQPTRYAPSASACDGHRDVVTRAAEGKFPWRATLTSPSLMDDES